MTRKLTFLLTASLLLALFPVHAQELQCQVTVNSDQIEGSNKSVFNTLQTSITEFVNTTRWTNMTFTERERIECSMLIVIQSVADNLFTAELQVQSRRPVFGSSYITPLLNFKDNYFNFTYQEYDRLEYQPNSITSNLAAGGYIYHFIIIYAVCAFIIKDH